MRLDTRRGAYCGFAARRYYVRIPTASRERSPRLVGLDLRVRVISTEVGVSWS